MRFAAEELADGWWSGMVERSRTKSRLFMPPNVGTAERLVLAMF